MYIDSVENVQKPYTRRVFRKCMKPYANYENRLAYLNRKTSETRRYIMSQQCFIIFFINMLHVIFLTQLLHLHIIEIYVVIIISFLYLFVKQILEKIFLVCIFYQFGTFYHLKLLDLMFVLHLHIL